MKARLFLSYARIDGAVACDFFHESLKNAGYSVWRDVESLPGGEPWRQRIEDAIREVDVLLLFLTPGAIASANVREEWEAAIRFRKRVVPLLVTKVQPPLELAAYTYRDITEPRAYQLEPSFIQKDLENERAALRTEFEQLSAQINTLPEPTKKYLEPFVEHLRRALAAEPAGFPPEVLKMLLALLGALQNELAAGADITPLVDSMAAGTYAPKNWREEPVYRNRLDIAAKILGAVRKALPSICLPVIVVAMTQTEAAELDDGSAFSDTPPEWKREFDALRPNLPADWMQRYGATKEAWKPFGATQDTIETLVRAEFRSITPAGQAPLWPWFLDIVTLLGNRPLLLKLRATGCLVVIDGISAWHPRVHAAFRASCLDVSRSCIVLRLLPDQTLEQLHPGVGFLLREWLVCEFIRRANVDLDGKCDSIHELFRLRKFMKNQVGDSVPEFAAQQSDFLQYLNKLGS